MTLPSGGLPSALWDLSALGPSNSRICAKSIIVAIFAPFDGPVVSCAVFFFVLPFARKRPQQIPYEDRRI